MNTRTARVVSPLAAVAVTLLTVAIGTGLVWSVRDRLPDPVAIHWGPAGVADGFQPLPAALTQTAIMIPVLALFLVAITLVTRQAQTAAIASGTSVLMGSLMYGSVWAQQGITDPAMAPMPNGPLAVGFVGGIAVGACHAVAFRTKPGVAPYPRPSAADGAVRAHVPASARLAWSGALRHSGVMAFLPVAGVALMLGLAVWMWVIGGPWWMMLVIAVALGALTVPLQFATLVIDTRGVQLRMAGRNLRATDLSQITTARVVEVRALRDYGGIGYRGGFDGSSGIITSSGPALRLGRFEASDLVYTVDGADQAAAVVNTLIDRQADSER